MRSAATSVPACTATPLGGAVGLGYVENAAGVDADYVTAGRYEIEVAGVRYPAKASLRPLYDPRSSRIKT